MPKFTLFHGTDLQSAQGIAQSGFKVSNVPSAGRSLGNGVYAVGDFVKSARHGANIMLANKNSHPEIDSPCDGMFSVIQIEAEIPEEKILRHNLAYENTLADLYHDHKKTGQPTYSGEHNPQRDSRMFATEGMYGKSFAQLLKQELDNQQSTSLGTSDITEAAKKLVNV